MAFRDDYMKNARRSTNVELALPNSGKTVPYRNRNIVKQTVSSLFTPALADGGVEQPSQTPAPNRDVTQSATATARQGARSASDILSRQVATQDTTGRLPTRTPVEPRRVGVLPPDPSTFSDPTFRTAYQKDYDEFMENNPMNPPLFPRVRKGMSNPEVWKSSGPLGRLVGGMLEERPTVAPPEPTLDVTEAPLTRTFNADGTISYEQGPNTARLGTPRNIRQGLPGESPARPASSLQRQPMTPGIVSESKFFDTYGGYDLSGLSPEERLKAKVAINDRATNYMRETREMYAPKQQPGALGGGNRSQVLREYREELSKVLRDSKNRRLTARGTANALEGLRDYYGEALGLSPKEQAKEANLNYRAELAAQSGETAEKPFARYDFDVDDDGKVRVFDKVSGAVNEQQSAMVSSLLERWNAANADPNVTQETKDKLKAALAAEGYNTETL